GADTLLWTFKLNFPPDTAPDTAVTILRDTAEVLPGKDTVQASAEGQKGVNWMPKLTVTGRKLQKSGLGKQTISKQAIKQMPGLAEPDVMRAVQMLPGVVASSDFSNKLYVRGGSSDQNLILLDMATVYNPSHFGGFFSTFNVDAIKDMEFYKGGFPSKFGNRLSSVLSISQRSGREGYFHGGLGLSLLSGKTYIEGGVPGKAHWIWTYRRTWIDWALARMNDAGLIDFELPYYFYDSQGKVDVELTPDDTITVSGYIGDDNLDFEQLLTLEWGNRMLGTNWTHKFRRRFTGRLHLSYSRFEQVAGLLEGLVQAYNGIEDWNGRLDIQDSVSKDMQLSYGGEYNYLDVNFTQRVQVLQANEEQADTTYSHLFALYGDIKLKLLDYLRTKIGLRQYLYGPILEFRLPDWRIDLNLALTPSIDLLTHVGTYTQYLTSMTFSDFEIPTEYWYAVRGDMRPSEAILWSVGSKYKLNPVTTFSIEGYYKNFEHLPIFAPQENAEAAIEEKGQDNISVYDLFHESDGYAFGLELFAERKIGILNGYTSYSLSFSVIRERDSIVYFPRWDKRHAFSLIANIDWMGPYGLFKREKFSLQSSLAFSYSTGLPFTQTLGVKRSQANRQESYISFEGDKYGQRYPVYSRVDVTLLRGTHRFKYFDLTWYYQIINIFDRENVYFYQFDYKREEEGRAPAERETFGQIPRVPVFIGFELEF
ncbi:MAG: TonB-dependent receptor plug domain-containing protein, partial [Planctomycetota bacterium]